MENFSHRCWNFVQLHDECYEMYCTTSAAFNWTPSTGKYLQLTVIVVQYPVEHAQWSLRHITWNLGQNNNIELNTYCTTVYHSRFHSHLLFGSEWKSQIVLYAFLSIKAVLKSINLTQLSVIFANILLTLYTWNTRSASTKRCMFTSDIHITVTA